MLDILATLLPVKTNCNGAWQCRSNIAVGLVRDTGSAIDSGFG